MSLCWFNFNLGGLRLHSIAKLDQEVTNLYFCLATGTAHILNSFSLFFFFHFSYEWCKLWINRGSSSVNRLRHDSELSGEVLLYSQSVIYMGLPLFSNKSVKSVKSVLGKNIKGVGWISNNFNTPHLESNTLDFKRNFQNMSDIIAACLPGLGFVPWWPPHVGDDVNATLIRGER